MRISPNLRLIASQGIRPYGPLECKRSSLQLPTSYGWQSVIATIVCEMGEVKPPLVTDAGFVGGWSLGVERSGLTVDVRPG
jgi:hypothetical protein